jgi:hypothetical protein
VSIATLLVHIGISFGIRLIQILDRKSCFLSGISSTGDFYYSIRIHSRIYGTILTGLNKSCELLQGKDGIMHLFVYNM